MTSRTIGCVLLVLAVALLSWYMQQYVRVNSNGIALYATDRQYLCNALINVSRLRAFGTTCQLIVLMPLTFIHARPGTPIGRLVDALRSCKVIFVPMELEKAGLRANDVTYEHSLQKLEILSLHHYRRLLYFDTDGLILKSPDHLFHYAPDADLILPEAYYTDVTHNVRFSSAFMLLKPSLSLYQKAQRLIEGREKTDFDMEIINKLTQHASVSNVTLPYRGNLLLTGLFRDHTKYSATEEWNAQKEWDEAVYIHFSDAPIPKPWIDDRGASLAQHGPKCPDGQHDCAEVRIWRQVYRTFRDHMRELCPSPMELDL